MTHKLIALTGFSRSGKDEAATPLIKAGWVKSCMGSVIKSQINHLCIGYLGFSSFTENDEEKNQIRGLLETWGDTNYSGIMSEFFGRLPNRCVNTRLCRVKEAEEWRKRGGIIVEIRRASYEKRFAWVGPGNLRGGKITHAKVAHSAQTPWEAQAMANLHQADMVDLIVENDGTVEQLHDVMTRLFIAGELSTDRSAGNRCRTFRCSSPLETYAAR